MNDTLETVLRIAIALGLAVAIWQLNSSMERIADALTRIADRENRHRERTDQQTE